MSTATLPKVGTPPPANGKDLALAVTHTPATRPDGMNLVIEIGIGPYEATFHCQDEEHVGTHKQRQVFFHANEHCWLIFDKSVFVEPYLELVKDVEISAYIADSTKLGETSFTVRVPPETETVSMMTNAAAAPLRPPVIVVP